MQKTRIKKNDKILFWNVEVAKSVGQRIKGLSGRNKLGSDGLLFVFPREAKHSIWMPNMKFPIDIVFINRNKRIISIKQSARPISINPVTWRIFRSNEKAKYVLEIPAGSAGGKLKVGDALDFNTPSSKRI